MAKDNFKFLEQTRRVFRPIEDVLQQSEILSDTLWKNGEEKLLAASVGPQACLLLIQRLQQQVKEGKISSGPRVYIALQQELTRLLGKPSMLRYAEQASVTVMVVMGDKGSGKTTTTAKLAYHLSQEGHKVLLSTSNVSGSNSVDSLKVWGEQINVPVIAQSGSSDPSTVAHDALQSALTGGYDVVLIDTASRLEMEKHHMEELKNTINVVSKVIPGAPHELLMVIDAANGQNVLPQVRDFAQYTGLTGVILSKVDSTAKGGCAFTITDDLGVPIKFLGTGENIEQLVPFEPESFVAALFEKR